jgi:hypothetical protein
MPGWARRLRIMIDWFFALLFRPDIVKISLDSEDVERRRETATAWAVAEPVEQETARDAARTGSPQFMTGGS